MAAGDWHRRAIKLGIRTLISGIRPAALMPLLVNSLIETNLGMPYIYLIYEAVSRCISD
jgi:hypothetical protein